MQNEQARDEIARLEEQIALHDERIARCRKLSFAARIAIGAGAAWVAATLLSLVWFVPSLFFGAIALTIGGVVLLGSNKTSWEQTEAARAAALARRMALIGEIELRVVDDGVKRIH